ncbi:MAG: hypothetical protein WCG97_03750 [bacterium]
MKKLLLIILICVIVLFIYIINSNGMKNVSNITTTSNESNSVKIGEIVNYTQHPKVSFEYITISYLGSTPMIPATSEHVHLSGTDKFEVSSSKGKTYPINWSSGTGDLPGPSYLLTNSGCYEMHINVWEKSGGKSQSIQGNLVLVKTSDDKCGSSWALDLR